MEISGFYVKEAKILLGIFKCGRFTCSPRKKFISTSVGAQFGEQALN